MKKNLFSCTVILVLSLALTLSLASCGDKSTAKAEKVEPSESILLDELTTGELIDMANTYKKTFGDVGNVLKEVLEERGVELKEAFSESYDEISEGLSSSLSEAKDTFTQGLGEMVKESGIKGTVDGATEKLNDGKKKIEDASNALNEANKTLESLKGLF